MCLHGQALKNQSFATIGHSDLVSIHRQRGGSNIGTWWVGVLPHSRDLSGVA